MNHKGRLLLEKHNQKVIKLLLSSREWNQYLDDLKSEIDNSLSMYNYHSDLRLLTAQRHR